MRERDQARERAGVNTRARVRTCTDVGIHAREHARTNVLGLGLNFRPPHTKKMRRIKRKSEGD
jgi:hypothetical protein